MHWKNNTRDWQDAPADRISWRLVEGLEMLQGEIEAADQGGYIDYVRLRRPPVGAQAKRSKSRYVGWDNLEQCRDESAQSIAAELSAAAEFVCRRDKCGEAYEAQVSYLVNGDRQSKSISFHLSDGPSEEDDDDDEKQVDGDDLTPDKMTKLLHKDPVMLMMLVQQQSHRDMLAILESGRRIDSSRIDKLLSAVTASQRDGRDVVDKFMRMVEPVLDTAFKFTQMGADAVAANIDAERANKEAEMETEFRRERLKTMESALGGLTDLAKSVGLPLMARAMGVDPGLLMQDVADQAAKRPDEATKEKEEEMTPDERNQQIKTTATALRESLTDAQLTAIASVDEKIGSGLRSVSDASTPEELRNVVGTIKNEIQSNMLLMGKIAAQLDMAQQVHVLTLLELVFPTGQAQS